MACGCKKPKQEQPTQPPVSIRLTEVQTTPQTNQNPPPQSTQPSN